MIYRDINNNQKMPTKRELRMAAKAQNIGAMHILVKHSESSNPVCKRNGQPIKISKDEALAEMAAIIESGVSIGPGMEPQTFL